MSPDPPQNRADRASQHLYFDLVTADDQAEAGTIQSAPSTDSWVRLTEHGPTVAGQESQVLAAPRPMPSDQPHRSRLANIYIWLVISGSVAATAGSLFSEATARTAPAWDWPLFVALIIGVAILERAREDLFGNSHLSLSFVAIFSGGLLLAPGAVGAAALMGLFVAGFPDREDWERFLFNVAVISLSGVAYSTVFHAASPAPTSGQILELLPAALGSALVAFTINSSLVAGVVSLTSEQSVVAIWREKYAWLAPHYLAFGVAAYAMVVSFLALGTVGAAIFAMPIVMLWFAVRQYTERTRESTVELQRANLALGHSEKRYRALVQNAPGVTIVLNPDSTIQYVSSPIGSDEMPKQLDDIVNPRDLERVESAIQQTNEHPEREPMLELKMPDAEGQWRDYEATLKNLADQPAVGGVVINARDVTDRKRLENELRYQAFHDPLTNLPNRALFMERLDEALAETRRTGGHTAVLFIGPQRDIFCVGSQFGEIARRPRRVADRREVDHQHDGRSGHEQTGHNPEGVRQPDRRFPADQLAEPGHDSYHGSPSPFCQILTESFLTLR
jgi:PAS domain S-box-containing protein